MHSSASSVIFGKRKVGARFGSIPRGCSALLALAARCWRSWKRSRSNIFDLKDCSHDEITRIANYLGISPGQLHSIASCNPDRANLLQHRMRTLDLDAGKVARGDSRTWDELRRLCENCDSRGRCALDLATGCIDAGSVSWRVYCPNARTLGILADTQCGTVPGVAQ